MEKKGSGRRLVRVVTDGRPTAYLGYITQRELGDTQLVITDQPCIDEDLPLLEINSLPN